MTTLRIAAVTCLLATQAADARAQQPDRRLAAPPRADTSPTGYSCTVDTLISGADCVFEGNPTSRGPGVASRSLADAGSKLCSAAARPPGEARPDAGVRAACKAEVVRSLDRCGASQAPLVDAGGRFLPSSRACYAALGNALARARTLAATVAPCCRCLAEARCGDARACVKQGLGKVLSGAEGKCAARACSSECGPYLPHAEGEEEEDEAPKASPRQPSAPRFDAPNSATKDT